MCQEGRGLPGGNLGPADGSTPDGNLRTLEAGAIAQRLEPKVFQGILLSLLLFLFFS